MYNNLRKIQDVELAGKTVVVRANYDVRLKNEELVDNSLVQASIETIQYLIDRECKVVVLSHLGSPKAEVSDELSLMPVRFELGKLLNKPIKFAHLTACENSIKFMEPGEILMIENLKFNASETSKNKQERIEGFKVIAELCHLYISEAFGIEEELASVVDLPKMMPSYAGFQIQKEIANVEKIKNKSKRPALMILGGTDIEKKLDLLKNATKNFDTLLLGGTLALEFLAAEGVKLGKFKPKFLEKSKKALKDLRSNGVEVILPVDFIGATELNEKSKTVEISTQSFSDDLEVGDIGQKTLEIYRQRIESAQTVVWNGPMGKFEIENFNRGTEAIGEYIALSAPKEAYKVVLGEETLHAMNILRVKVKRFNHFSPNGASSLELLANQIQPFLEILEGKQSL